MTPRLSKLSSLQLPCDEMMISKYVDDSKEMVVKMSPKVCQQVPSLNDSVVIPSVDFKMGEWNKKNKTKQGREILCSLRMLSNALPPASGVTLPQCTKGPLEKLSKVIDELYNIVKKLITQEEVTQSPLLSEDCKGKNTTKVLSIFDRYRKLVQGKIVLFLKTLPATNCSKKSR